MNVHAVLTIARLTLREAMRRRLLVAVCVLTLVLVGISAWGFQRITSLPCESGEPCSPIEQKFLAAILLTLMTFMYSFVFALGAVFIAAPAISSEVESGVLLAILPRPLHRSELLLGKWLGVAGVVGGYAVVTTGAEFAAVGALVGYTPPHPFLAIAFLVGQSLVMLTLSLLLSTRLAPMTGGIIALALFGLAWIGGIAQTIGTTLGSDTVKNVGVATRIALPADGLWRGALYNIQPSFIDALERDSYTDGTASSNPFFVIAPPSPGYVAWALAWIASVLGLAMLSFRRRDI